jgi:two-component system, OmpR family, sensor kinase
MFRSIRWTLQLWHAAILGMALVSFGTALYLVIRGAELSNVDAELERAAHVLTSMPPSSPPGAGGRRGMGPPPWERGWPRGRGMPAQNGSSVPPDMGGRGLPPNGPQSFVPEEWWTQVPRDVLLRIGQSEQDQPYFIIWGRFGETLQASSPSLIAPPPDFLTSVITRSDERQKTENGEKGTADSTVFRPPAGPPFPSPDSGTPAFRQRGVLREVILRGPLGTRVLVGKSIQAEEAVLKKLRWELLSAGLGVLAIGLCGGWLLSRRITRPIYAISATARAISASDLSRRIDVKETDSELGSLAQTLNETFDRLETAFQRQVRFTADASHELRTPLSIIHSHAELALTRDRSVPEYRQAMETCLRAAKRTKSLVDALLVLARADAGKLDLKYERFNLKDAVDEALAMVAAQAQERNIGIEADVKPIELEADHTRILQLLTNLLVNAIQYNRQGGRVVLTVAQQGSSAILMVADTGAGIATLDQPYVFERFFRADKARSRETGGSGLGLAICQSIAEAHHGSISFTSRPGEGTTFTVQLPIDSRAADNLENSNRNKVIEHLPNEK